MNRKGDIRAYFGSSGGAKKAPAASALSAAKVEAQVVSPKKERETKKRPEKITPKKKEKVPVVLMGSDSDDGESPVPASVKKSAEKAKSKRRARIESDSDDEIPRPKAKASKIDSPSGSVSYSSSPKKSARKPRVHLSSDEDEGPYTPKKKQDTKQTPEKDDDVVMETDSEPEEEEEFVEKKSKKKGLLPGQKKLSVTKGAKPIETPKASTSEAKLTKVNPTDFFGKPAASSTAKKAATPKKTEEKVAEKKNTTPVKQKKKESPKKKAKKVSDDEFVDSDEDEFPVKKTSKPSAKKEVPKKKSKKDSDDDFVLSDEDETRVKKVSKPSPKKEAPKKKKDSDNEFVSSDDEVPPKKTKPSPSSKENLPQKTKSPKVQKKDEKKDLAVTKVPAKPRVKTPPPAPRPDIKYEVPWVDKYKPKSVSQLVGQHGDKSPMNKLMGWLNDWAKHNLGEGRHIKKPKPSPFQSGGDGSAFKAALLSGSPGIGKTTCAHLACETLGLVAVEMNASDVRNKKHLEAQIAQLTGSHQIEEYFGSKSTKDHDDTRIHHVLIMDEVDGMSGNEDRAGMAELIQIIKDTRIPILCICNDRTHPKIRSLSNYCFDLRFQKPRVEQIRARIMSIAAQEKIKINKEELDEIIELSGHDVRQTIYNLQMRGSSVNSKIEQKDCAINTFEAARKLLDTRTPLMEKQEMFFTDYGIMPLFVQENYLNMKNKNHSKLEAIRGLRKAADLISLGDTVDRCIRSTGAWKLLNEQSMLSAALPAIAVDGHLSAQLGFPSWLGKNSTANKRQRLMRQLASHAHLKLSADTHSIVTDYVPVLRSALTKPLIERENDGVPDVVAAMTEYDLLKDDAEAIAELAVWPGKIDPASKIQSKVKAALTRALNKEHRMLPYHLDEVTKGRKKATASVEVEVDEDGNLVERVEGEEEPEEEEDDDKPVAAAPSTSAARGRGGGARGGRGGAASSRGSRGSRGKK